MKSSLEDWFTAKEGETAKLFYYDSNWGTLIGYPSSYGSDEELNDHHFHYGYFLHAAAQIALRDPQWASRDNWGAMVELLIKDIANWDRNDTRFPFLRNLTPTRAIPGLRVMPDLPTATIKSHHRRPSTHGRQ